MSQVELRGALAVGVEVLYLRLPSDLQPLLEQVPLLADPRQLHLDPVQLVLQAPVGLFEVVALLQPLRPTVLRVAAVLERAALLLQSHHLLSGAAVQPLVEFPHRQRHQHLVVEAQVVAAGGVAAGGVVVEAGGEGAGAGAHGLGPEGPSRTVSKPIHTKNK